MLFISDSIYAAIIYIPSDQPTVEAGIDVAVDGDIVLFADGGYSDNDNIYLHWDATTKYS